MPSRKKQGRYSRIDTTELSNMNDETVDNWNDQKTEQQTGMRPNWEGVPNKLQDQYRIYAACVPDPVSFDEWLNN